MFRTLPTTGALVLVVALAGCSAPKNEYQAPPPPEVTVANPIAKSVAEVVEFTGQVEAAERVELRARVKGFLESYDYVEGERVTAGKELFLIDPKPFEADLQAAQAALQLATAQVATAEAGKLQAQAKAANADAQLARAKRAAAGGAVTQEELDNKTTERSVAIADFRASEATLKSAEAQVDVAEAQVEQAKLDLGYTVVKAPISGRVSQRRVDVGNLVGAEGATVLAEIVKNDPVQVYFSVSEKEHLEYIRGRGREFFAAGVSAEQLEIPVRLQLEGEAGFPHEGMLDYAGIEIDSQTGTYPLRAELPNPDSQIPVGAFARVQLSGDPMDGMLVPDAAISRSATGAFVIVVGKDNKCQRRDVTLAHMHEGMRVVVDGLTVDDRVVTDGLQRARPGVEVRPTMAELSAQSTDTPAAPAAAPAGDAAEAAPEESAESGG